MIFNHLKYIKPIWYFHLKPKKDYGYFPTEKQLEQAGIFLKKDTHYKSPIAQIHDLSWTAFQSGFIADQAQEGIDIWQNHAFSPEDEYRFLRKNIHKAWVLYVLLLRIFTFHNPLSELYGYLKTRTVKRVDYSKQVIHAFAYENYVSNLIKEKPLVSVVIFSISLKLISF